MAKAGRTPNARNGGLIPAVALHLKDFASTWKDKWPAEGAQIYREAFAIAWRSLIPDSRLVPTDFSEALSRPHGRFASQAVAHAFDAIHKLSKQRLCRLIILLEHPFDPVESRDKVIAMARRIIPSTGAVDFGNALSMIPATRSKTVASVVDARTGRQVN
jgi:hypothetical protein